jgi:uncharacterized membrane protein
VTTPASPDLEARNDRRRGQLLRAALGLLIEGASVALALGQLVIADLATFASGNALAPERRIALLAITGAGVALAALAIVWIWRRVPAGADRTARFDRAVRLGAPLALAAALPGLFTLPARSETFTVALVLGAFVLAIEPLFRLHFAAYRPRAPTSPAGPAPTRASTGRWACLALGAAVAFYIAYMVFFTLRNHAKFQTFNWDLGQLDNQFFNALHGHPFRCTPLIREGNWSELRNHAEFSVYALLPFYALHPAASTLLVLQSALLGSAAIPLYRFAARRLSPGLALLVALAYLAYPPMHGAQMFDFHFQPVSAAFLLAAIDAFDRRRMRLFVVFWVVALGCREDVAIGTMVLGLFLLMSGQRTREGAVIAALSAVYFVVMRFVVMPSVGSWGFAELYKDLVPRGTEGFPGIVKTMVTNPTYTFRTLLSNDKARYALQILAPLAFLPLRRPWLAVSVVPGAILTLLTTGYGPTIDIGYQYGPDFVPYIFPAAVLALELLGRGQDGEEAGPAHRRAAGATLALASLVATAAWGAIPPRQGYHSSYGTLSFAPPTAQERRRLRALDEAMVAVPRQAILAASDRELPHVSNRIDCWNLAVGFEGADYIIYTKIDPITPDREQVARALAAGWRALYDGPEIGLLARPGL